jgi:hypothetical protein
MSDNEDNINSSSSGKSSDRSALMIGAIGLLAIASLLLPPLPPWFRVIAVALVVLAVLGGLGVLPGLRATWRRWLSDLPSDDQRTARWKRAFGLIGVLVVALLLLPPLSPRLRVIAVVLAVLAVLGMLGVFPNLRATWRRWLSGLITILVIILALQAYGPLPPPGFWRGGDGPTGVLRPGWVASRPMLSWVPNWLIPTTTGTVRHFTLTSSGELDGIILDDGTEVDVPPHLSAQLAAAVRLGDSVRVRGYGPWFEPVIRAASITDVASGGLVIDTGPPPPGFGPPRSPAAAMQPISAQGRLDMWLHGPAGDVNGALLADGTILRFPPPLADQLEGYLIPGQAMRADGWGMATAYGTVVAVQTFETTAASATAPAQPPGKSTTTPTASR